MTATRPAAKWREVPAGAHEIELDTVDRVGRQDLFDDGQPVIAHALVAVVEGDILRPVPMNNPPLGVLAQDGGGHECEQAAGVVHVGHADGCEGAPAVPMGLIDDEVKDVGAGGRELVEGLSVVELGLRRGDVDVREVALSHGGLVVRLVGEGGAEGEDVDVALQEEEVHPVTDR
jgi:hypothetical protein